MMKKLKQDISSNKEITSCRQIKIYFPDIADHDGHFIGKVNDENLLKTICNKTCNVRLQDEVSDQSCKLFDQTAVINTVRYQMSFISLFNSKPMVINPFSKTVVVWFIHNLKELRNLFGSISAVIKLLFDDGKEVNVGHKLIINLLESSNKHVFAQLSAPQEAAAD